MVVSKALQRFESVFDVEAVMPEWSCRGLPLFPKGKVDLQTSVYGELLKAYTHIFLCLTNIW